MKPTCWLEAKSMRVCAVAVACLAMPVMAQAEPVTARPTADFLNSIGVVSTFPDRGQPLDQTISMVRFGGFRWVRAGIEGLTERGPTNVQTFLDLHRTTGVKFSWGLMSTGSDLPKLIDTARVIAKAGALLAFEGNNEPNNWAVTYQGEKGGGRMSWMAVAKLQRDLYQAVKNDRDLKDYPVWTISEPGAQSDNVGLQFLKIPAGARTMMPDGTVYADAANVHNYIYHPNAPVPADNKTWDAADPTSASRVDGLYGNYGKTWARGFIGYSENELANLSRVTTETGVTVGGQVTERLHAVHLTNVYLAQFKRGYSHTAVYLLRDRTDEGGNQAFGFFRPDYTPRPAAVYLHNLTTILSDKGTEKKTGQLDYSIPNQPKTVHDLLLQKSDSTFQLVVWGEKLRGDDKVKVKLGQRGNVTVFDATAGTQPGPTYANTDEIELTVSDYPLVLLISPL